MMTIRRALRDDLDSITEIYNDVVLKTVSTFDTEPKIREEQEIWFADHDRRHPLLVAESDGLILGWASLSRWSERLAYIDTAEFSFYVAEGQRGRGIGRALLEAIIMEGRRLEMHTIIARITEGNDASFRLLESAGFEHIGIMREVGKKFGKLLDVHLMQMIYDSPADSNSSA